MLTTPTVSDPPATPPRYLRPPRPHLHLVSSDFIRLYDKVRQGLTMVSAKASGDSDPQLFSTCDDSLVGVKPLGGVAPRHCPTGFKYYRFKNLGLSWF